MTTVAANYSNFTHSACGKGYLVRPDSKFVVTDNHKYFRGWFLDAHQTRLVFQEK